MFMHPRHDPYEEPHADAEVVRVESTDDMPDWIGLVLYADGAAPISDALEHEHADAVRELLAVSPLARVGAACSERAVAITAYAAVDPVSRNGYLEVWIDGQDTPEWSDGVSEVVSLRRLLRDALRTVDQEALDLQGADPEGPLEIDFSIPKEMPPRTRRAAKGKRAKGRIDSKRLTRAQAQLKVRELLARAALVRYSNDEDEHAVVAVADELRRGGYEPRIDTRCSNFELTGGYCVTAEVVRRFYFGKLLVGEWSFPLDGEGSLFSTGLMLQRDCENPPVDGDLIERMGVDFDEYGDFPCSWDEAWERFGDHDEDDDDD